MRINRRKFLGLGTFAFLGSSSLRAKTSTKHNRLFIKEPAKVCSEPWLEINLRNMAWNVEQIRKRVKSIPIMAVIKANAYGLGLVPIGKFLEKQGITNMAVIKLQEALSLREAGVKAHILNFSSLCPEICQELVRNDIAQSAFTDDVVALSEAAQKLNKTAEVHIKIDTGLNRVGVPYYKALAFIKKVNSLQGISIVGVFTTLTEDKEFDLEQLKRLQQVCQDAQKDGIDIGLRHAMSSGGIVNHPSHLLDMVRPGIMLYGYYSSEEDYEKRVLDLKPAVQLKAPIAYIKELRPGDGVSYGRLFVARKKELIATLPIGYSDGLPHNVVDKAQVIIKGKRYPIIAKISANHSIALITGSEGVNVGDEAVLIGAQGEEFIPAEELAKHAQKSIYQLLCGFSPFLPRIYPQA